MNGIIKNRIISGCLFLTLLFFFVSPVIAAQKEYKDKTITFYYPETWELSTEKNGNYEIKLRPKNWLCSNKSSEIEVADFALYISISNQTMEEAATAVLTGDEVGSQTGQNILKSIKFVTDK